MRLQNTLFLFLAVIFIFSCKNEKTSSSVSNEETKPSIEEGNHFVDNILTTFNIEENTEQIIVSYNQNQSETTGELVGFEKVDNKWQLTFDTIDVNFGKNGFAIYDKKMEGDGTSPTGVFELGKAFGYVDDIAHDIDFITLNKNHYWDSDSKSKTYNQLLTEIPETPLIEVMRRKDHLYKYGVIIEYNTKETVPEKGSAIFLHVQRRAGGHTTGCISMEEEDIIRLIKWLKPSQKPMIAMGSWSTLSE